MNEYARAIIYISVLHIFLIYNTIYALLSSLFYIIYLYIFRPWDMKIQEYAIGRTVIVLLITLVIYAAYSYIN